jgi:hypothetical protein
MTIEKILKASKVQPFIKMIEEHLKEHNGKIIFKIPKISRLDIDGEFSEFNMTIKCYLDLSSNYWIGVLAHEYAHFLQCTKESQFWTNFQNEAASIDNLNDIFKNKKHKFKINKPKRHRLINHIVKMELDCDKMAIKLINKWKLPVDKKEYITKANIVLYKYLYWAEYGIWPSITDKNTNKTTDWRELKLTKLMTEDKYESIDDIPRKLFYIFHKKKLLF